MNEKIQSQKEIREKKNKKDGEQNRLLITIPAWEVLELEKKEINPQIWIFIYSENYIIKKIKAKNVKGFNRVSWNLLSESKSIISSKNINKNNSGYMVNPGEYSAQLFKQT